MIAGTCISVSAMVPAERAARVIPHLADGVDLLCEECRFVQEVD